jgi:hypothetical protein
MVKERVFGEVGSHDINREKSKNAKRRRSTTSKFVQKRKERKEEAYRVRLSRVMMEKYQNFSLEEKLQFALDGYRFKNHLLPPPIKLSKSFFKCEPGRDRGILVTSSFPELPEGFIILFSKRSITLRKSTGLQSSYQIALPGNRYLQTHTQPFKKHGLANFVNAAISKKSKRPVELQTPTEQNMKESQCRLVYTKAKSIKKYKKKFPVYIKTIRAIPQGHELLLPSNYGGKHKVFA